MAELNSSSEKQSGTRRSKRMSTRVDLTAMVDLAFLLITFFILTTTLTKPRSITLTMPVGDIPGGVPESRTMTVCLGTNNKAVYYVGLPDKPKAPPRLTSLGPNGIRKAIMETAAQVYRATGKQLIILIKPAEHSVYANLVTMLDEMNITQTQQFAIADISPLDVQILKQKNVW